MKYCSKCAIEYADVVVFCSHCGTQLTEGPMSYVCPNCNQNLGTAYEQFCPHCGQQFNGKASDSNSQTSIKAKSSNRNLIIAISVIAILVGGYFGFKQELINHGIVTPSTAEEHYIYSKYLEDRFDFNYKNQLELAADKGHAEAAWRVGQSAYQNKDYSKGIKYLKIANLYGHKEAPALLAFLYRTGTGVEKNLPYAMELYEKSAKYGDDISATIAGTAYMIGVEVDRDIDKAIKLLETVANNPKSERAGRCQVLLGQIYWKPVYKRTDVNKAVQWFTKAYENGKLSAILYLQIIYHVDPVLKNYAEALKWAKIGAQKGIDGSMAYLYCAYAFGWGVPIDYETSEYWREKFSTAPHNQQKIFDEIM